MEKLFNLESPEELVQKLFGTGISSRRRVSGGDINEAYLIELSDGQRVFLKENRKENSGFFSAEAEGLKVLSSTGTIGLPNCIAIGSYKDKSFLLMEYLESGSRKKDFWEILRMPFRICTKLQRKLYCLMANMDFIRIIT